MAFLEDYTLLDELGQGGYATVYKVRHNELGYIRALRVLNAVIARGAEDKAYQRFIDECRLLMRIGNGNHPNIVHISKTLLKEQRAAVEMDYVDGTSVMKYVKKCGGFVPIEDVMQLLEQMSSALAYCHHDIYRFCMDRLEDDLQDDPEDGSKVLLDDDIRNRLVQKYRVIHNDIHSDNIIRREDGSHILLDFGLAIQGDSVVRSSRRSDGAPEFKAPEKWDTDTELTTQSDIYSFGVVLYEYLTGRVPFPLTPEDAGSAKAIYMLSVAHKSQTPDSIFELRKAAFEKANPGQTYQTPDYPLWLEEVIMRCLEKDPQERFRDGKELHDYVLEKKNLTGTEHVEVAETQKVEEVVPVVVKNEEKPILSDKSVKMYKRVLVFVSVIALAACLAALIGFVKAEKAIGDYDSMKAAMYVEHELVVPLDKEHPAIKYLDGNHILSRKEMEQYPELIGLWDALNTYDYIKISSYFERIQASDNYTQTLMHLRSKRGIVDNLYNSGRRHVAENEDKLSVMTYLFTLIGNQEKSTSSASQSKRDSAGKNKDSQAKSPEADKERRNRTKKIAS